MKNKTLRSSKRVSTEHQQKVRDDDTTREKTMTGLVAAAQNWGWGYILGYTLKTGVYFGV